MEIIRFVLSMFFANYTLRANPFVGLSKLGASENGELDLPNLAVAMK